MTLPPIRTDTVISPRDGGTSHLAILDGWRGLSILAVLAAHMLPLGPAWMKLNEAMGFVGMSLFFILSGLLITRSLLRNAAPVPFLIKRLFRIVPLAWLFIVVVIVPQGAAANVVAANLFFYANHSQSFLHFAPHLWSLSVEMEFYIVVAMLVAIGGRRSLALLPILALLVTAGRIARGQPAGIETLDRVDEILAGATLALALHKGWRVPAVIAKPAIVMTLLLLILIGGQADVRAVFPILAYLRPYLAAAAIGSSLFIVDGLPTRILAGRPLRYIAGISYALYVIHPHTYAGWLGQGDTMVRYLKRIVSFMLAFAGAHISTRYFELPLNRFGHRLASGWARPGKDDKAVQA